MENEKEKKSHNPEIKRCFAMHCANNSGGKCNLESICILVNGMCDNFKIRTRGN